MKYLESIFLYKGTRQKPSAIDWISQFFNQMSKLFCIEKYFQGILILASVLWSLPWSLCGLAVRRLQRMLEVVGSNPTGGKFVFHTVASKLMSESSESGALSLSSAARHWVAPYLCCPRSAFHSAFTTILDSIYSGM